MARTDLASRPVPGAEATETSGAYRTYVLIILTLIYAINFLDRQVINILAESIKRDLNISDTQLGLLTGTAFGIFYSIMGLPIARLADRKSRVKVITFSLTLWSGLTAMCGAAQSYAQLFLIRLGVGVGEAGGTPPSQSLISDYFPRMSRATAMAVFNVGVPIGSFLGFLLGGYINDWWGWRMAFVVAGLPGLLLVLLVKFTIREPIRGAVDGLQGAAAEAPPFRESLSSLLARKSFLWLVFGGTFGIFVVYVAGAWLPPFFIRVHGMAASQIGGWIALAVGLGGAIGAFGGGILADMLKRYSARSEIWVLGASTLLTCPAFLFTVLAGDTGTALAGMFILYMLAFVWMGPTSAMIQHVAPVRSRALATGIQLFVANIISLAMGPPLVGLISDSLAPTMGNESLRYALACAAFVPLLGTVSYLMAGRYILRDGE